MFAQFSSYIFHEKFYQLFCEKRRRAGAAQACDVEIQENLFLLLDYSKFKKCKNYLHLLITKEKGSQIYSIYI